MGSTYARFLKALLFATLALMMVAVSAESMAQKKKKKKKGKKAKAAQVEANNPQNQAREHYNKAKKAYDEGDFVTAETEFQAAYDIKPHPAVLKSIAECKIQTGQAVEAISLLEQLAVDESYDKKAEVEARLVQAKAEVGELDILSNPPGATVEINGVTLEQVTPTKIYLIPGDQNVVVKLDTYDDQIKELTVEKGTKASVSVDFIAEPVPEEQPELIDPFEEDQKEEPFVAEESKGPPPAFWAMAAITGVGLVSGTVFGTMALGAQNDYESNGDQATKDSGKRSAVIADVSFGIAIGAAIAGTIILIVHNKKKETPEATARLRVAPILSTDAMGLASSIQF